MRENGGTRSLEEIKVFDEEVGKYLFENYCKKEKRSSYRIGKSYAEFLATSTNIVLNDRILWVKGVTREKLKEWSSFINEYNKKLLIGVKPALFILEVYDGSSVIGTKYLEKISFNESITAYDRYAFCTLISTDLPISQDARGYLANLVSVVSDDVELCAQCIRRGNEFLDNPADCIKEILNNEHRDDGTQFVFAADEKELSHRIWEGQIGFVFPALERYRLKFIELHKKDIRKGLPIESAFGEVIENAEDAELGTLLQMTDQGGIQMHSNDEYGNLRKIKQARNDLAHLRPLDYETIKFILSAVK